MHSCQIAAHAWKTCYWYEVHIKQPTLLKSYPANRQSCCTVTVQAATSDASVARAALTAAEQRISSLEAALAQSSSAAVSMTSQIAQTMADTSAQVNRHMRSAL